MNPRQQWFFIKNIKIGIDAANGAASTTVKMLFDKLGINYEIINANPDGININENAGSTHLEGLQKFVMDNGLDCGIAFDGDADRCLFIDELGNVIKYSTRAGKKENNSELQDLLKAREFLNRRIKYLKGE